MQIVNIPLVAVFHVLTQRPEFQCSWLFRLTMLTHWPEMPRWLSWQCWHKARVAMLIELTMLMHGPELSWLLTLAMLTKRPEMPWWLSWQCWHKGQSCHDDWVDNAGTRARVVMMIELTILTQGKSFHDDWIHNVDTWARVVMTVDIGNADTKARVAIIVELTMLTHGPELFWLLTLAMPTKRPKLL